MKIYPLNKSIISVQGEEVWQFLNGLTSNVKGADKNAFLTIHGKIMATFDQSRIKEDEFLLLVEKPFDIAIVEHLKKFVVISHVKVMLWPDHRVYFDMDNSLVIGPKDHVIPQEQGKLFITSQHLEANVSDEEYTLFRLKHNMPLHSVDYKDEFLLNVSVSKYVSFNKGCYLGQEPVSKVISRSKPSRRLEVRAESQCSDEEKAKMTSKAKDPQSGETVGFVFVENK